jgi:hypothetical protein
MNGWGRAVVAAAALSASAAQATSPSRQCVNRTAETRCAAGRCSTTTEAFTPMRLRLERKGIELCAYSGCWDGSIRFRHSGGDADLLLVDLHDRPQAAAPDRRMAILLDRRTRHAQVSFADFALVMECSDPG